MTPWDQVFWQIIWPPAVAAVLGGAGIAYARWLSKHVTPEPKTIVRGRIRAGKKLRPGSP